MIEMDANESLLVDISGLLSKAIFQPSDLLPKRIWQPLSVPELPAAARLDPALGVSACTWLDDYIEFSRKWSPRGFEGFHEAVGVWLLSVVAARRVAIPFGKMAYTGLYIALASRTSVFAKSTTAEIGQAVLKKAGLAHLLSPDDATPQKFINLMTHRLPDNWEQMSEIQQEIYKERLSFAAQKGWYYDEFGQKISSMMREGSFMADFRGILRRIDDDKDSYDYATMTREDNVRNAYLAMLANLTPDDLKPFAKKGSALWGDGFWARWAFITPPMNAQRRNDRMPRSEARVIPDALTAPLREWHHKLGIPRVEIEKRIVRRKTVLTPVVEELRQNLCQLNDESYAAFYAYSEALGDIVAAGDLGDLTGNYTRFASKALRLAALFANFSGGETIELRHWARAQVIAERWRTYLHNIYDQTTGVQVTRDIELEERVMKIISEKGPRTKRELCQASWGVDSKTINSIIENMVGAGFLTKRSNGRREEYGIVIETEGAS